MILGTSHIQDFLDAPSIGNGVETISTAFDEVRTGTTSNQETQSNGSSSKSAPRTKAFNNV
jgi:hypothetical protein